ncbi:MAG: hypothetical protein R3E88_22155 [Myxococcota bacterium]
MRAALSTRAAAARARRKSACATGAGGARRAASRARARRGSRPAPAWRAREQARLGEARVHVHDEARGAAHPVVGEHEARRVASFVELLEGRAQRAARRVEPRVHRLDRALARRARARVVARRVRVVVAPVVVPDGVALAPHDHRERGRALLGDDPQRLEREALLALDAREQRLDGALVEAGVARALVDVWAHPRPHCARDAAVESRVARAPLVGPGRDGGVEAAHEQAVERLGRERGGHPEHEHAAARVADAPEERRARAIARVREAESIGARHLLREVEDAVVAGLEARRERRPGGERDGRDHARQRRGAPLAQRAREVRQLPPRDHRLDHREGRAVECEHE